MTAFQVTHWNNEIKPIEVEKTTASFAILPRGRREGLRTEYGAIFINKPDAEDYLRTRLTRQIGILESQLADAKYKLNRI